MQTYTSYENDDDDCGKNSSRELNDWKLLLLLQYIRFLRNNFRLPWTMFKKMKRKEIMH